MEITVSHELGRLPVSVLHVKGDIDMATAEQIQAQARRAYDEGARNMLLDLSHVPYMSSAGVRAIHEIFTMLRGASPAESDEAIRKGLADGSYKSPHLKLLSPSNRVLEVLKMTGLDMFLEIHRNLKDAVASF